MIKQILLSYFILAIIEASPVKSIEDKEWLIYLPPGSMPLSRAREIIRESDEIDLVKEIVDDNEGSFNAFSLKGSQGAVIQAFNCTSCLVSENAQINANAGYFNLSKANLSIQNWGLKAISGSGSEYLYPVTAGEGVSVYILDSGIEKDHSEFESRVELGFKSTDGGDYDHGTHVAGIVAGKSFGVARKATLIDIEILDSEGSGTHRDLIRGIQFVMKDVKEKNRTGKAIMNLSLSGPKNDLLDQVVKDAIEDGIYAVVAAGNQKSDACTRSPGKVEQALTVASSANDLSPAVDSNYGSCVDIYAPGVNIWSSGYNNTIKLDSGTSMAAPHVSGVLALILAEKSFPSVAEGMNYLFNIASKDRVKGVPKDSPNLFLSNGIKSDCNRQKCSLKDI